jgi:hypothetical protein
MAFNSVCSAEIQTESPEFEVVLADNDRTGPSSETCYLDGRLERPSASKATQWMSHSIP